MPLAAYVNERNVGALDSHSANIAHNLHETRNQVPGLSRSPAILCVLLTGANTGLTQPRAPAQHRKLQVYAPNKTARAPQHLPNTHSQTHQEANQQHPTGAGQ